MLFLEDCMGIIPKIFTTFAVLLLQDLYMEHFNRYREEIDDFLKGFKIDKTPRELYDPVDYILHLGGKRLRPMLTLFSAEVFGVKSAEAIYAAVAIEMFHNFSLIHDDIMDEAPLRRGFETVHKKWDINTGILSGDAMLILAYQYFENYEPIVFRELAKLFSKTALEVCEGQQMDMNFEVRTDVTVDEYIHMISYKTAVLVGAAFKMGAIVANADEESKRLIYDFGLQLGIAFQIQDDFLDTFGDSETFGKKIGGDILENKKTYLYLNALQNADLEQKKALEKWFASEEKSQEKIDAVKQLYIQTGAYENTKKVIENYTNQSIQILDSLVIEEKYKEELRVFSVELMDRKV